MKNLTKVVLLMVFGLLTLGASPAFAVTQYDTVVSAVNAADIVLGIAAIAGVLVLPKAAAYGFRRVLAFIR